MLLKKDVTLILSIWTTEKKLHWDFFLCRVEQVYLWAHRALRKATTRINARYLLHKTSTQKDLSSLKTTGNEALYCLKCVLCEHGFNLTTSTGAAVMSLQTSEAVPAPELPWWREKSKTPKVTPLCWSSATICSTPSCRHCFHTDTFFFFKHYC